MHGLELVLLLLAASAGLRILAERWRIPYATLLVLGGLAIAAIPNAPHFEVAPDVLFLIFVPPLLYWGATAFPLRDLRRQSGPILRLAVLMVLVSTAAVAVVVHAIDRTFTWPAAVALGAIVSPPDPVAVLSITRWVRLPRDIERILEGEGLLNDATALVLYRAAVAAGTTGAFAVQRAVPQFFLVGGGGVLVGLVVGAIALRVRRLTRGVDVADNTISLLTPFAAYLAAEAIGTSGVLSVVAAAMHVGRNIEEIPSPASRVQGVSTWTVTTFLLESLVFILVGIELPRIVGTLEPAELRSLAREGSIVFLCLVLARLLWVFPSAYIGRFVDRLVSMRSDAIRSWRDILFVGWSGIRGGDSLIIALALPLAFPARDRIIFITFCVIFASLVLQAPTLRPLAHVLRLPADGTVADEEAHARLTSIEAGLRALDEAVQKSMDYPEVARYLRQRHRQRARRWAANEATRFKGRREEVDRHHHGVSSPPSHESGALDERRAEEYRRVRSVMIGAERRSLRDLRNEGDIGDDVMLRVERELDLEQLLLDGAQPVVEMASDAARDMTM